MSGKKRADADPSASASHVDRYRRLFDAAPVMYHSLDATGRILECNATEARVLGYERSDLVGRHVTEILAPDDAKRWPADFEELLEHGSLRSVERRLRRKDGSYVDVMVDVTVEYDPDGRPAFTKAVFVDITERRRVEREMRQSLRQLETVFHGIRDDVILHDAQLRVLHINRHALERLGLSEAEALGRQCFEVFHGRSGACPGCPVERALVERRQTSGETKSRGGQFEIHAYPIFDDAGVVRGVVEYARDVGEERRLRAEALQGEKLRSLGQLAGGVAHDFNNLLGAIRSYGTVLLVDERDTDRRAALRGILAATNRAADLTRQLLSFARRDAATRRPVDLNRIVDEVASLLRRTVDPTVEIRVERDPANPSVMGDGSGIHTAVLNLCLNARDAMPSGGVMTIRTLGDAAAPSRPVSAPARRWAAIVVSDTGTGIDPEHRDCVLEPFFTTKGEAGTGLGLSTAFGIARAHEGSLEFDTEVGRGTTFRLLLPFPEDAATEVAVPASRRTSLAPDVLGRPPRVLVVEDELVVRQSLVRLLRRLGYEVQPAAGAADAVAVAGALGADSVDVVLMDLTLPDASAEETFRRLREAGVSAPVVLTSGDAENERVRELLRRGAIAFMPKPFDLETLGAELAEAVVRRSKTPPPEAP